MSKYRKKPVVIEAEIYRKGLEDGYKCKRNLDCPNPVLNLPAYACIDCPLFLPYIETLEGPHFISPGDFIITGVQGERYPCKPDIFAQTYELVTETEE